MGWQVAIVLDDETNIGSLISWLPVWAWTSPHRRKSAPELWDGWNKVWEPEPSLTLMDRPVGLDAVSALLAQIPTIEEHHPRLAALRFFGLTDSEALRRALSELGYDHKSESGPGGLLYARALTSLPNVERLNLDAGGWQCADDVYTAFFEAVGAPAWHGRDFDALNDSIGTGAINKIEVPYRIVIGNVSKATAPAVDFIGHFADLVQELSANGCPVAITIQR